MEKGLGTAPAQFSNPQEEIRFLREQIFKREQELAGAGKKVESADVARQALKDYAQLPDSVLSDKYALSQKSVDAIVLDLSPETHDKKMEELLGILSLQGIKNTLKIILRMNNAHIDDDFHRLLIQYVKKGLPIVGLKENTPMWNALHMTLYEVSLPEEGKDEDEKRKSLKELVSKMEQFYAGMLSVSPDSKMKQYFSVEITNSIGSSEVIFYVSVPDVKKELFEKQILSIFTYAKIREAKDDYNIFNEEGITVASYAKSARKPIFPVRTYDTFDFDPLNVILNAFSKISRDDEGAAIQLIFRPTGDISYAKRYKSSLDEIYKGVSVKKAINKPETFWQHVKFIGKDVFKSEKKKDKDSSKPVDQTAAKFIEEKIASPIVEVNIRIVVSSGERSSAERIINELESAFNQFENPQGNTLEWKRVKAGALADLEKDFSFRLFSDDEIIPLNIKEVTTLVHFPEAVERAPQLKQAKAGSAPAPLGLPDSGVYLGTNRNRNVETRVYMKPEDRLRHFYVIGQTGTGKTTLLKNMIIQDIANGNGVCMIDPHGTDIVDILANIPKERYEDVIYFDPAYVARPMGLNMLEFDENHPEQKTFVVNELFSIFQKVYGKVPESMGPAFEQYFRNSSLLVLEHVESGNTLVDISRVLSDKSYRDMKLQHCKNPLVSQFWRNAEKTTGEQGLANYVQYVTNKFDVFLANDIMRPIVSQSKSCFNFRDIMDNQKILLVNLSKGRLGDINSSLIGLIIVGKILMAALARVDNLNKDTKPFYLYIDEFQNVTTDSISTILSEARKYKLGLHIAHQFIAQLEEGIRDAVFGNVGSMAVFRVGAEDSEFLEKQFAPTFVANDLLNLDNMNAYLRYLVGGKPVKPFNIDMQYAPKGRPEIVDKLKELSYLKYGKPREQIEEETMKKFLKAPLPDPRTLAQGGAL